MARCSLQHRSGAGRPSRSSTFVSRPWPTRCLRTRGRPAGWLPSKAMRCPREAALAGSAGARAPRPPLGAEPGCPVAPARASFQTCGAPWPSRVPPRAPRRESSRRGLPSLEPFCWRSHRRRRPAPGGPPACRSQGVGWMRRRRGRFGSALSALHPARAPRRGPHASPGKSASRAKKSTWRPSSGYSSFGPGASRRGSWEPARCRPAAAPLRAPSRLRTAGKGDGRSVTVRGGDLNITPAVLAESWNP